MRKFFNKDNGEEHNFWISYTDLLSGFLVVFIIISVVMYNHYSKQKAYYEQLFTSYQGLSPEQIAARVSRLEFENDSLKGADLKNLIEEYRTVFPSNSFVRASFDTNRGSIILTSSESQKYLFASGRDVFEKELEIYLSEVCKPMVKKTMEIWSKHKNRNIELRIEGHTDPNGIHGSKRGSDESFMENLVLSSQRANKVYDYMLNQISLNDEEKDFVKKNMISVGYSFSTRVYNNNIDDLSLDASSRRIEFRIISK